jgi:hypothetical protein
MRLGWFSYTIHAVTVALALGLAWLSGSQSTSATREVMATREWAVALTAEVRNTQEGLRRLNDDVHGVKWDVAFLKDSSAEDRVKLEAGHLRVIEAVQRLTGVTEELGIQLSSSVEASRDGARAQARDQTVEQTMGVRRADVTPSPTALAYAAEATYPLKAVSQLEKPAKLGVQVRTTRTHKANNPNPARDACVKAFEPAAGSLSWARITVALEQTFGRPMFSVLRPCPTVG